MAQPERKTCRSAGVEPLYVMADAEAAINLSFHVDMENGFIFAMGWKSGLQMSAICLVRQVLRSGLPKVRLAGRSYFQEMWGM